MRSHVRERELLRHLASMPFLDRLELVALSGWSRGSVYEGIEELMGWGLTASVPHATPLVPPTRRFYLTTDGLLRLAHEEGISLDALLRSRPVSARWRRTLAERLDAVSVIYRLASTISNVAHPIRLRWFRASPIDAAIALPNGATIGVVRQGLTSDRTGFSKRLFRLSQGTLPSLVLLLMPDEVRLRHARRLLLSACVPALLGLEQDAASCRPADPVWRPPSVAATLVLRYVLSRLERGGPMPSEPAPSRASLPADIAVEGDGLSLPDHMLPAILKPTEKRCIDLLSDWPWLTLIDLSGLLGVSGPRVSQLVTRLEALGLATRTVVAGRRRIALTDRGLALLARRDRASLATAKKRWGVTPLDPEVPADWRSVSGRRSGQLLRNVEHTEAVHGFIAALASQCRTQGWEAVQLDPPRRASRYFRHDGKLHSVRPDAFGILTNGDRTWPFFLEWERRAVRPTTMAVRLAPYLRYYSSHRPTDDHGAQPIVLVVFHEDIAATHFLRVAREEMERAGVQLPLWVSQKAVLDELGPLGRAWRTPGGWDPAYAFPGR